MPDIDVLDMIYEAIELDTKRTLKKAKSQELDQGDANKLVQYGRFQLALEKHQADIEKGAKNDLGDISQEQLEELMANPMSLLSKIGGKDGA